MTVFTTLRGIATCSWLPWTTSLVPRSLRGYYLSRDRTFVNIASVAALAVSGLFLFNHDSMKAYSIVFAISFIRRRHQSLLPEPCSGSARCVRTRAEAASAVVEFAAR